MRVAEPNINLKDFISVERTYKLQKIDLLRWHRGEFNSHIETLQSPAVNLFLEPRNRYKLYYTFSFEGSGKPAKRFIASIESTYENDGKLGYINDSVVFKKSLYFYLN